MKILLNLRPRFASFPDAAPGIGLLLLRATAGLSLLWLGSVRCLVPQAARSWNLPLNLLFAGSGLLLIAGYQSLLVSFAGVLISLATASSLLYIPVLNLSAGKLGSLFNTAICLALWCLGPGAYSLDARRHGLREIVIPVRPYLNSDSN